MDSPQAVQSPSHLNLCTHRHSHTHTHGHFLNIQKGAANTFLQFKLRYTLRTRDAKELKTPLHAKHEIPCLVPNSAKQTNSQQCYISKQPRYAFIKYKDILHCHHKYNNGSLDVNIDYVFLPNTQS